MSSVLLTLKYKKKKKEDTRVCLAVIHYRVRVTLPSCLRLAHDADPVTLNRLGPRAFQRRERITKSNRRLFAVNELTRLSNHGHVGDRVLSVGERSPRKFPAPAFKLVAGIARTSRIQEKNESKKEHTGDICSCTHKWREFKITRLLIRMFTWTTWELRRRRAAVPALFVQQITISADAFSLLSLTNKILLQTPGLRSREHRIISYVSLLVRNSRVMKYAVFQLRFSAIMAFTLCKRSTAQ